MVRVSVTPGGMMEIGASSRVGERGSLYLLDSDLSLWREW